MVKETPVWNRAAGDEARRALPGLRDDVELLVAELRLRLADAGVDPLQLRRAERAHEVRLFPICAQRPLLLGAAAHEVRDGDFGLLFEGRTHLVGEFVHSCLCARVRRRVWVSASCARSACCRRRYRALNTAYWRLAVAARARNRVLYAAVVLSSRAPHACGPNTRCNSVNDCGIVLASCKTLAAKLLLSTDEGPVLPR